MIITISGTAGSGKSTVAKNIAKQLGATRIYVGGIRRELARKKKMTIEQLNEYGKTHPETDVEVDLAAAAKARKLEQQGKKVLVEGRTQFHFLPDSIKIFMKVDSHEAAGRIWKDLQAKKRKEEGTFKSMKEVERSLKKRDREDAKRYKKYYKIDHRDETQYDLIVDTSHITAQQAANEVLEFIRKQKNTHTNRS